MNPHEFNPPSAPRQDASPLRVPVACIWMLMLVTFSAPNRDSPLSVGSLDLIALAKLAVRVGVLGMLALTWASHSDRLHRRILWLLAPLLLFVGWAFLSVAWSPLKSVSGGQALGLLALVSLTAVVGALCRSEEDVLRLLKHVCCGLFVMSLLLGVVHAVAPDMSGLDRKDTDLSVGIVHPTSVGATASLGLVLTIGCRLLWDREWTRNLLLPAVIVHGLMLTLAQSRMALGVGLVVLLVMLVKWLPRATAKAGLAGSLMGTTWLVIDPEMRLLEYVMGPSVSYVTRGESVDLLLSLTGRTELWDAIWDGYTQSPLIGHGYFVTSPNGLLDVWGGIAERTAHNVFLQVLVSTGIVGMFLFLWAWFRLLPAIAKALENHPERGRIGSILLLLGVWYLGWGQLCESFMGPIQPESVTFFALLGLGVSYAARAGHVDGVIARDDAVEGGARP